MYQNQHEGNVMNKLISNDNYIGMVNDKESHAISLKYIDKGSLELIVVNMYCVTFLL